MLPLATTILLWTMARWHRNHSARLALRFAIPLALLISIALTVTFENRQMFSLVVAPFHFIVMLLAAIWTFVSLSLEEQSSVVHTDWFWIVGGVMLYAATGTAIQPLAWYLVRERADLLHAAFNARAAVVLLSSGAITWGMLRQATPKSSGGSSSPPSSPSSSSSAA